MLAIYLTWSKKSASVCILCELWHWALSEELELRLKNRLPIGGILVFIWGKKWKDKTFHGVFFDKDENKPNPTVQRDLNKQLFLVC